MRDGTIDYKVKVFISSKCGGRYNIVRKALKRLLEESNIATVYTFETSGPSSQNVVPSYISELEDSDLCIFLIDNADGIPDPVLTEYKRARQFDKKSIYLFCDENEKESTQLQNEIIENQREKYHIVHEFTDFINCYQFVIRDIVRIYRIYCRGMLSDKSNNEVAKPVESQIIDTYKIDKQLFKGFELTKKELNIINYDVSDGINDPTQLDKLCQEYLRIIVGKGKIEKFDFEKLKNALCETHEDFLKELISKRVDALKAYFKNDLEQCLLDIDTAYNYIKSNKKIPNWLANDVSVDMRNIQYLIDETENKVILKNKGQQLLDENYESVYYPLLDRFDSNLKEDVLKLCLAENIDSPYTIRYQNSGYIFNSIASSFIVSVMYGSLTNILLTRERIITTLSSLCFIYHDHKIYMEFLKLLILCQKDKDLEEIIRAYNQTTDTISESDVDYLLSAINTVPIAHKKMISKYILFRHFGYFFSEKAYKDISNELLKHTAIWIKNDNRIFAVSKYIFKSLRSNIYRLNHNKVLDIIFSLFEKGLRRFYDDAFVIIQMLDLANIPKTKKEKLIKFLILIMSDSKLKNEYSKLLSAVIYVRKNITTKGKVIDNCVKKEFESFYLSDYSLEVFGSNKECPLKHIERFIQSINKQNEDQGEKGVYIGYGEDPYQTIRNIIEYDNLCLNKTELKQITDALIGTVLAPKQTFEAKINAIKLLMYLKNRKFFDDELEITFEKLVARKDEIFCGYNGGFEKDSLTSLQFCFLLLEACFGKWHTDEMLVKIAVITQSDFEIIKSLQCIQTLLNNFEISKIDKSMLMTITQYVISMSIHKEKDIRYHSAKLLLLLCNFDLEAPILQLSKMMDNDTYEIKITILAGIKNVSVGNKELVKYIVQKGRIDNHYLVRKKANDIKC